MAPPYCILTEGNSQKGRRKKRRDCDKITYLVIDSPLLVVIREHYEKQKENKENVKRKKKEKKKKKTFQTLN